MKEVIIDNIRYNFPQSWDDVPAHLLPKLHKESIRYAFKTEAAFTILLMATGLPHNSRFFAFRNKETKAKIQNLVTLPGESLHTLLKGDLFLGFMFKPNGLNNYAIQDFWHKGRHYIGPARHILDLKTIELVTAYNMFHLYSSKNEVQYLNKLIGLLFRPNKPFDFVRKLSPDYDRDKRQKLNPYHWEKHSERLSSLDHGTKLTILRQFSTAWQKFEQKHKALFQKSGSGKYDPEKWIDILTNMAGGAFGTLEQIKMHNAGEVFRKINHTIIENREKINELKKQRKR